jgi:hypothetical protein
MVLIRFSASPVDKAFLQLSPGMMGEHPVPGTGVATVEVVVMIPITTKKRIMFISGF